MPKIKIAKKLEIPTFLNTSKNKGAKKICLQIKSYLKRLINSIIWKAKKIGSGKKNLLLYFMFLHSILQVLSTYM